MRTRFDPAAGVARQGSLRASNLSLVARYVFASDTAPARANVAQATGMTRSTASRIARLAPAPSGSGAVMWWASEDMPEAASSA